MPPLSPSDADRANWSEVLELRFAEVRRALDLVKHAYPEASDEDLDRLLAEFQATLDEIGEAFRKDTRPPR